MFTNVKVGFGIMVGSMLGYATLKFISEEILRWGAKDKEFMEYEKTHNPKTYEYLKNKFPEYGES